MGGWLGGGEWERDTLCVSEARRGAESRVLEELGEQVEGGGKWGGLGRKEGRREGGREGGRRRKQLKQQVAEGCGGQGGARARG